MSGTDLLGEFEQLVLLGLLQQGEQGFAILIRETLEAATERKISRGALYRTLDRLGEKGLVRWMTEAPTPERGGLPRKRFEVTEQGIVALQRSRSVMRKLTGGLEDLLGSVR